MSVLMAECLAERRYSKAGRKAEQGRIAIIYWIDGMDWMACFSYWCK